MDVVKILYHYLRTKKRTFSTREELAGFQYKMIEKHLAFVRASSLFYRNLKELPLMNKQKMMDHFDELNTVGISKEEAFKVALQAENTRDFSPTIGEITVGLSSGTSGNRGIFLVSKEERLMWAGIILAKALPKGILTKQRIAFFLRANSNLYSSVSSKRISFGFYDLLDEPDAHLTRLNDTQPDVLVAPPSMMRYLAEQKKRGQLRISPIKVITVAEVLDPLDEAVIQEGFNQQVHQIYQCTEGFLATTCSHGTLHLNEDLVKIDKKFLDNEKTKFHPIITDFTRKTQPIIRYELNDILTLKEKPCPCGSVMTAIEQIEGRSDDLFYFPKRGGAGVKAVFPDFIRRAVITADDRIEEYKVIQTSPSQLHIHMKTKCDRAEVEAKVREGILEVLESQGCEIPVFHFLDYQFKPGDKKLRRVERTYSIDECGDL
ncbi:adenylate cyclase [Bacillus tianshenii]|nr:adenylate cyclase [Bacillus tianshenii]